MDKVTQAVGELKELVPWLLKDPAGLGILVAVGVIAVSAIVFLYFSSASSASSKSRSLQGRVALNKDEWRAFKLIKKEIVTHDTRRFVFALPSPNMVLGLPIGQHVLVRGRDSDGNEFSRPYTPTSLDSDLGILELVVKVYPSGKMSQFLDNIKVGEGVEFKGPKTLQQGDERQLRAERRARALAASRAAANAATREQAAAASAAAMASAAASSAASAAASSPGTLLGMPHGSPGTSGSMSSGRSISQMAGSQLSPLTPRGRELLELQQVERIRERLERELKQATDREREIKNRAARLDTLEADKAALEGLDESAMSDQLKILKNNMLSLHAHVDSRLDFMQNSLDQILDLLQRPGYRPAAQSSLSLTAMSGPFHVQAGTQPSDTSAAAAQTVASSSSGPAVQQPVPQQGQSQGQWYPKTPMKPPLAFSGEKKDEELNTWLRTVLVWVKAKRTLQEEEVITVASYLEVLAQQDGKKLRPIEYVSKKMPSKKLAKSTYERELYALYKALVHWRHFLLGRFFYLRTDHQTLKWIKTQPALSDALKRWMEVIDQYDFKLEYLKGEYNKVADALFHRADYLGALVSEFGVSEEVTQSLVGAYQEDTVMMDIMRKLQAKDKATERHSVSMDFMDTLVTSKSGKRHIFVIIDRFTKYARLVAMPETARTDHVIKLFMDNWVRDFGLPKSIASGRDVRFTSELWKKTAEHMGSQLQMTSGNHPEANGQAEQMNRVVQHLLRHYIKPSQDDWDEKLPLIASLYNNVVHSSTDVSPNQLHLGWKPISALDFLLPENRSYATPGTLEYGVQYEKLLQQAVEHIKKAQQAMIASKNKHRRQSSFQALVCGPLPMTKAMGGHLDAVGYSPEQQFRF
ncbi:hypothetical protein CBR_g39038 [Chara braunii]|uniref:cytochrome-b5 reductase n=1 Tax=Chara braunii TaxID=69332 RepID=A0A388LR41_CHABU|nr:hypothetical protein CBR_g39038 [Chara braunii]|eukprot:GBG84662.1 hypothetical protein CBR_g39038 [Chara braunii]